MPPNNGLTYTNPYTGAVTSPNNMMVDQGNALTLNNRTTMNNGPLATPTTQSTNNGNPFTGPSAQTTAPKKQGMDRNTAGSVIGAVTGGVSGIFGSMFPGEYDQRVGMEKPNAAGKMMGDLSLTSMGTSIMPGWGTAIGFAGDMIKNAVGLEKANEQYRHASNKAGLYESREKKLSNLGSDYTGMAKYGTESDGQPIEMEADEIVVVKDKEGNYQEYAQTGPNAPSHEEGGVTYNVPNGALVFDKTFLGGVKDALAKGDNKKVDQLKEKMMVRSTAAALAGMPFSNKNQARFGTAVASGPADPPKNKIKYKSRWNLKSSFGLDPYSAKGIAKAKEITNAAVAEGKPLPKFNCSGAGCAAHVSNASTGLTDKPGAKAPHSFKKTRGDAWTYMGDKFDKSGNIISSRNKRRWIDPFYEKAIDEKVSKKTNDMLPTPESFAPADDFFKHDFTNKAVLLDRLNSPSSKRYAKFKGGHGNEHVGLMIDKNTMLHGAGGKSTDDGGTSSPYYVLDDVRDGIGFKTGEAKYRPTEVVSPKTRDELINKKTIKIKKKPAFKPGFDKYAFSSFRFGGKVLPKPPIKKKKGHDCGCNK